MIWFSTRATCLRKLIHCIVIAFFVSVIYGIILVSRGNVGIISIANLAKGSIVDSTPVSRAPPENTHRPPTRIGNQNYRNDSMEVIKFDEFRNTVSESIDSLKAKINELLLLTQGISRNHSEASKRKEIVSTTIPDKFSCIDAHHPFFPLCSEMIELMEKNVKKNKCYYGTHKLNQSRCSIFNYLTQIEPYCAGERSQYKENDRSHATPRFHLKDLLKLMSGEDMDWMRGRAKFVWPEWEKTIRKFSLKGKKYARKRVILFMGAFGVHKWMLKMAGKGGPLGELVQWVDLISGLFVMGHELTLTVNAKDLSKLMRGNDKDKCATGKGNEQVDVIYTDITGVWSLIGAYGEASLIKYKCMYRILDTFGTYAEYNYPNYPYKVEQKSFWGNLNVLLPQFLTLYPHTPDNSFLGFVVTRPPIDRISKRHNENNKLSGNNTVSRRKKSVALLYAKMSSYVKGYERFLEIISEFFEIHSTCVIDGYKLPKYVHNHGPVSLEEVQRLLSESKLFIGVGFPYEGPGPMEAMAAGATYIQPKFEYPRNSVNTPFFGGKPNVRGVTSQSPYMEEFVGEPYCYTINATDEDVVRGTLKKILKMKRLPPKIPVEFTNDGMIERVYAFTNLVDYCNPYSPRWPPLKNMKVLLGVLGQSCKDACMSSGLVCERSYFHEINTKLLLETYSASKCHEVKTEYHLHSPSLDRSRSVCYLQKHEQLFSCMHSTDGVQRLCTCRDYEFEQTAICKNCLN